MTLHKKMAKSIIFSIHGFNPFESLRVSKVILNKVIFLLIYNLFRSSKLKGSYFAKLKCNVVKGEGMYKKVSRIIEMASKCRNKYICMYFYIVCYCTGGPLYMRSFYVRIRVSSIGNWVIFWNITLNLQSFLVFLNVTFYIRA